MADFVAVLTKTIDGLGPRNTADMRQRVYERAKKAISDKLAAISPPPSPAQAERQYKLLDDAIAIIEGRYAPVPPVLAPLPTTTSKPLVNPPKADRDPLEDFLASAGDEAPTVAAPIPTAANESASKLPPISALPSDVDAGRTRPPLAGSEFVVKPAKRGGLNGLLYALLGVLVIGGAGYAGYLYKDKLQSMLGMGAGTTTPAATPAPAKTAETPKPAASTEPAAVEKPTNTAAAETPPKFTQRLTPEGQEIDAGPGSLPTDVGEGSTVASATTPSTDATAAEAGQPAAAETIAVGQKAIFYEEKTGTEAGTADQGDVVWSQVMDSPGVDQPQEPAIRGDLTIPGKGIKVRLTIKRNGDKSLPASHIIEMVFTTPPDFAGGAVETVQRMALKDTEQAPGSPLVGVPAAFGDGFFLIALTDEKTAIETNTTLLQRQNWIDVPVAYRSGRRALLSFEKGLAGDKVFKDVFRAWEAKGATAATPAATGG